MLGTGLETDRAWLAVPRRTRCGSGTSNTPLNCFAGCPGVSRCFAEFYLSRLRKQDKYEVMHQYYVDGAEAFGEPCGSPVSTGRLSGDDGMGQNTMKNH